MFSDLVEEVRWLFEGKAKGERNPEKESEEQERKRKQREAYARSFAARQTARAKKARMLRRQLMVSKDRAAASKARTTSALKARPSITKPAPRSSAKSSA